MSVLTKGQRAANHYIMVEKIAERTSSLVGPDGQSVHQNEVYCQVLNISYGVEVDKVGYGEGDIITGPRILWVPGLPKNVGLMSAGDVFYSMKVLPDGVMLLSDRAIVDDFERRRPKSATGAGRDT